MLPHPLRRHISLAAKAEHTSPQPTRVGIWLRRYRRFLPYPLCVIALVYLRPVVPWGVAWLDTLTDVLGVALCILGQGVRLWAWGSNATVGKHGVRERGPYRLMRHPLYAGNFLILLGLLVIFNNPFAYPLFLIPFAYLYAVITDMEEARMSRRFGADYHNYRVDPLPRFLPALGNMRSALSTTAPFGWGLAWRKEYESCCGWLAGVVMLEIYEGVLIRGWVQNWPHTKRWLVVLGLIGLVSLVLGVRKYVTRPSRPD